MPKPKDPETTAMQTIALVLAPLAQPERDRIARWAYERYAISPFVPRSTSPRRTRTSEPGDGLHRARPREARRDRRRE